MTRLKSWTILAFALAFGALGCKGGGASSAPGITLQISATTATVILTKTDQMNSLVTGSTDTAVMWSLTCATGVTSCGTIDATSGVYTAPDTLPSTATVTIMGVAHASSSVSATTTITIISGITLSISPTSATIGTGEHIDFMANVTNPGCDNSNPSNQCTVVNWSASTGTIDLNGEFIAPMTATTATITAKSVKDMSVTQSATVTIVTAQDPTLTSVSPNIAAVGSLFQDIYITGTNFLATTRVFINDTEDLDPGAITAVSTTATPATVLRVRISSSFLATPPPSCTLTPCKLVIKASQQNGAKQLCTQASNCEIKVSTVRPAVVGPSPDSILESNLGVPPPFNINGGFFGPAGNPNPTVHATYDGKDHVATVSSARQVSIGDPDLSTPGLHPVAITNNFDPAKLATANLAVQPDYNAGRSSITQVGSAKVGTNPQDVAIDTALGIAVVANHDSNDVTLIDLTTLATTSICTGSMTPTAPCLSSGPVSVAVDSIHDIALVVNATSKTIARVNLNTKTVTGVSSALQDPPVAVGVNPINQRALVAINRLSAQTNYGVLVDSAQATPTIAGVVTIGTGPNAHVAVEPHLNWAVSTPGGVGSVGIVDLSRQTTNSITNLARSSGTVTVTVAAPSSTEPLLAVQQNDAVLIQGISADTSFNGVYTVTSVGPGNTTFTYSQSSLNLTDKASFAATGTASYAEPVVPSFALGGTSVAGIGIDPETQKAVLLNSSTGGAVLFLDLLNTQSSSSLLLEAGIVAAAFNPLTNVAVAVNKDLNQLSVIDPSTPPKRLNSTLFATGNRPVAVAVDPGSNTAVVVNQGDNNVSVISLGSSIHSPAILETSPKTFEATSTLANGPNVTSDLTLTILGKGFTSTSQVRLDGVQIPITKVTDRVLVATVPHAMLNAARRFAVDVLENGAVPKAFSNVSDFTVVQSVDVTGTNCAAPMPAGVAVDPQQGTGQGLAVVTLSGCNTVALIDLATGTGATPTSLVPVGSNPAGVAVLPRLGMAVVANNGSGNTIIIDEVNQKVASGTNLTNPITTGSEPMGVAADQDTGEAAVANSGSNTVTVINLGTGAPSTVSTGQRPIAVAFNYANHQIAVAESGSASSRVGIVSGTAETATYSLSLPTSVIYDPVPGDCGTSNTAGCFLANSSTGNLVSILDPTTNTQAAQAVFGVGINPTAIAYNYLTSTLVSTNTTSHTLTVVDLLGRRVRAVLNLPTPLNAAVAGQLALTGALQFGVDIDPLTNLAVIADTANGKVLFVPLPH